MDQLVNPFVLYGAIALGGVGVALALPRRGGSPQVLGALLAALGGVGVLALLGGAASDAGEALPSVYFYLFGAIALAAALRVITHKRPVYAALYFILTILSSAGLYLILSAEFMAFALVIVYAGAILITYLFVIMLATQAPVGGDTSVLAEYDRAAREPVWAAAAGFVLLAGLTTLLFSGARTLAPTGNPASLDLAALPGTIETALREDDLIGAGDKVVIEDDRAAIEYGAVQVERADGTVEEVELPADAAVSNTQSLAYDFLHNHPATIEIAGVILLMAMLGATVLSRRQVILEEEAKQAQMRALGGAG